MPRRTLNSVFHERSRVVFPHHFLKVYPGGDIKKKSDTRWVRIFLHLLSRTGHNCGETCPFLQNGYFFNYFNWIFKVSIPLLVGVILSEVCK